MSNRRLLRFSAIAILAFYVGLMSSPILIKEPTVTINTNTIASSTDAISTAIDATPDIATFDCPRIIVTKSVMPTTTEEATTVASPTTEEEIIPTTTTEEEESTLTDAIGVTDYEFTLMCQAVECEVHGGDKLSKMHVAHVILNRVRRGGGYGNSIAEVCLMPNQFGSRGDIEESTREAVREALVTADTTQGALHFRSGQWTQTFCNHSYIFTDDVGHHFY